MATLKERIDADLKDAMRSKNELTLSVLRMLKSAVKYKEVEPGASALDDDAVQKVINTLIKQRRESVDQFKSGGRPELAEKEEQEIAVLQKYLPQQLSAEELSALVTAAISESGAQGPKDMGAVMKNVNPKIQGRAEGRAVSDEVKAQLSKLS
ncbi:GatB/YqeY domain-containing protein [Corallococcus praedator]|uniref:GatB/YqeY domain-containing protein n=1 Tax=Corallococcus praedator TaxID=2316724 RepID=A0ABX9QFM4_9BACT|nr:MULTISPECIES: GatB/YqeY domain-containing protein [Corallococcus]RKG99246.1 GatB/YqeY domain-containing protein [Corallococcus sp. CA047B]RKH33557.1 GatB/YqeY domain-containing protein [Corallococcus sp. CA031C]RKI02404.1 GatB/YqeY domain-containing protein [Corallococcus praedator]